MNPEIYFYSHNETHSDTIEGLATLSCLVAIFGRLREVNVNNISQHCRIRVQQDRIQLYFTTLATHNKSWFPGGA